MRLVVEQQGAVIGIAQNRPAIVQESTRPVFQLDRQAPRLEISGGGVSVRIEQTQCFIERGLKPPSVLANECARAGRGAALEGVARRAREGDFLAAIEEGATVADVALPEEKCEVALALLPRTRPVVEFIEEPLQVNAVPGKVTVDFTPGTVSFEVPSWPYLQVYLQQEPFIRVKAVPEKIDVAV
ncbi:MAG: DUF6470 family protein [Bacillota bacterium]